MSDRYFTAGPITADRAVLTGAEAHHLLHVMRAAPGSRVTLFDGSGCQWSAEVRRIGRDEVELAILARSQIDRELSIDLTLAVALPKGERQKWLVEKAVELGVRRMVPLETARGVAQPAENALGRLRRGVIEASKQCGRNRLMEIAPPADWATLLASSAAAPRRWMAHPGGQAAASDLLQRPGDSGRVVLAVGPEGGFTDEEVAQGVAAGWQTVDLGPRTLRVETAALMLVVLAGAARSPLRAPTEGWSGRGLG